MTRLITLFPLVFLWAACTHYVVHPGSLNKADSAAYDTLLVAESAIDQARIEFKAGKLPFPAKNALDNLIKSYNVARESWLTYRGVIGTTQPQQVYLDQLNKNMYALSLAITALRTAK